MPLLMRRAHGREHGSNEETPSGPHPRASLPSCRVQARSARAVGARRAPQDPPIEMTVQQRSVLTSSMASIAQINRVSANSRFRLTRHLPGGDAEVFRPLFAASIFALTGRAGTRHDNQLSAGSILFVGFHCFDATQPRHHWIPTGKLWVHHLYTSLTSRLSADALRTPPAFF